MLIRKYQPADRSAVENIQFETYFLGKSASGIVDDRKRITDGLRYYLERDPESCFVAEDKGEIVGYVLGCLDDKNHNESILYELWKAFKPVFRLPFMSKKDRRFAISRMKMVFDALTGRSEDAKFKTPLDSGHIHINLLARARGKGVGTKLLKGFFRYAKSKGVKKIHADSFDTSLNDNRDFWKKNGFRKYCRVKTSFWKEYYPQEKIDVICYVKEL